MSGKQTDLKERFRIALSSTAKVISDDIQLDKRSIESKKPKHYNTIEIDKLSNKSDFIRLRAETDSGALKKKFSMMKFIKKSSH